MPDIEKLIEKWKRNPTEERYQTIKIFLEHFGYQLVNVKGSHFHFKQKDKPFIAIIVHHKKVKKIYLKRMLKILQIIP